MAVEREEGKKERRRGAHLINMDGDIVTGKLSKMDSGNMVAVALAKGVQVPLSTM